MTNVNKWDISFWFHTAEYPIPEAFVRYNSNGFACVRLFPIAVFSVGFRKLSSDFGRPRLFSDTFVRFLDTSNGFLSTLAG